MTLISSVLEEMLPRSAVLQMNGQIHEAQLAYCAEKRFKRRELTNEDIDRLAIALALEKLME